MPSRVAVGPAQGRAVAAGAGLQRCDRGLPWAAIACGSAAAYSYCYCESLQPYGTVLVWIRWKCLRSVQATSFVQNRL